MSNYVLIPCAGKGSRFGSPIPKQYTKIGDKTVIEHTLNAFLQLPEITEIVVVVSIDDNEIDKYALISPKIRVARVGSGVRAKTVLNGLNLLKCEANDWVLVHDAARCCIRPQAIKDMLIKLNEDKVGGILAIPVNDTLKHVDNGLITKTVNRNSLYHAQTPQMFRYNVLHKALSSCDLEGITDDASAVEALGLAVHLVLGDVSNIKLTYPSDIKIAEFYLGSKC
jgi:2-C-methyl-D-erythritol 4-phosphate cytidylyltransferase